MPRDHTMAHRTSLKRYLPCLEWLKSLSEVKQSQYLQKSPVDLIKFLCDTLYNVSLGIFNVGPSVIAQLKPYKKLISKICEKKRSLKQRRNLISRKGNYSKIISPLIENLIDLSHNDA